MIHTPHINQLGDEFPSQSCDGPGSWKERFERYAAQARDDFAMYAWLESQGKLPNPKRVGENTAKRWRAARSAI